MRTDSSHPGARESGHRRVILHLDMDAFYAAIEVRENPALQGKPVIVGHRGRRGVVSTCSYEARRFGVRSAMPSVTAERLCPRAVWLPGRMGLYGEVSGRIRKILDGVTPVVEPVSIDEAFLDLTGICGDLAGGARVAELLKKQVFQQERLTASVGVSPNKFLAKIASDMDKPDGLVILRRDDIPTRLWPLPVDRLWGVGPKTASTLREIGLKTIRDLVEVPGEKLGRAVGPGLAEHLVALARGEDDRPVENTREVKSISEERTYAVDLRDPAAIHRELLARAEGVARSLRDQGLRARTVHLKVRTGGFTTWTRAKTLPAPAHRTEEILSAASVMLRTRIQLEGEGIRLLGIGVSGLEVESGEGQLELFPDRGGVLEERLVLAEDAVRRRFGEDAVTRAGLIRRRKGSPPGASSPPATG